MRCFYPLKNNPNLGTGQGPDTNKVDSSLFRENEVRDACVQTDAGISGVWSHATRDSALANQSNGKCQSLVSLQIKIMELYSKIFKNKAKVVQPFNP